MKKRSPHEPDLNQRVDVKCDECGKQFNSTLRNRESHFIQYSKDLCASCKQVFQYKVGLREKNRQAILEYNFSEENRKTFEEKFGKEKAEEIKQKISLHLSGENNPMYGDKKHTKGFVAFGKSCKGKTIDEIYGKEKAEKIRKIESSKNSGKNNPMYGRPSPLGSGNGWCGWYKNFFFRSILELSFLVSIKEEIKSAEYIKIPYNDYTGKERNYLPDFISKDTLYEIKPFHLVNSISNKLKFEAAKEWCNKNNLNFKIITENDIRKLTTEEIVNLYKNKEIKFIERYEKKFLDRFNKEV